MKLGKEDVKHASQKAGDFVTLGKEDVINALQKVEDPDFGIDIWRLGFVQGIVVSGKNVKVSLKLSCYGCPISGVILENAKNALKEAGFENAEVELITDSPWEPSEEVESMLR